MSLSLNKVVVAGNLTRDPQTKFLAGDKAVCEFGMAINRRWKGSDGQMKEDTTFVEVQAWGRTAELVGQYLTKGSPAYVEGRLSHETWDDKKDGTKRSKTRIVADTVQFLGQKKEREATDESAPALSTAEKRELAKPATPRGGVQGDDEPPFAKRGEWE